MAYDAARYRALNPKKKTPVGGDNRGMRKEGGGYKNYCSALIYQYLARFTTPKIGGFNK
jgi:hypothetical protein